MKFFGVTDKAISIDDIADWLQEKMIDAEIESDEESEPGDWQELTLLLDSGEPVVDVIKLSCGTEEFDEAIEETVRMLLDSPVPINPSSAVRWLCQYMKRVKVIYNFSPLLGLDSEAGWVLFDTVWKSVRKELKGIVFCEGEGFTNEEGAQITCQFTGTMSGQVNAALLGEDGEWQEFILDLSDNQAIENFQRGQMPH